jgi:hypothetical protein
MKRARWVIMALLPFLLLLTAGALLILAVALAHR